MIIATPSGGIKGGHGAFPPVGGSLPTPPPSLRRKKNTKISYIRRICGFLTLRIAFEELNCKSAYRPYHMLLISDQIFFYRITLVSYSYTKLLNFSVSIGEIYIIYSKIIFVRDLTQVLCLKTKENEYCIWVTCQMVCKRFCNSTLHFALSMPATRKRNLLSPLAIPSGGLIES